MVHIHIRTSASSSSSSSSLSRISTDSTRVQGFHGLFWVADVVILSLLTASLLRAALSSRCCAGGCVEFSRLSLDRYQRDQQCTGVVTLPKRAGYLQRRSVCVCLRATATGHLLVFWRDSMFGIGPEPSAYRAGLQSSGLTTTTEHDLTVHWAWYGSSRSSEHHSGQHVH